LGAESNWANYQKLPETLCPKQNVEQVFAFTVPTTEESNEEVAARPSVQAVLGMVISTDGDRLSPSRSFSLAAACRKSH